MADVAKFLNIDLDKERRAVSAELERVERDMASLHAWEDRFAQLGSDHDRMAERRVKLANLDERLASLNEIWPPRRGQSFEELLRHLSEVSSLQCRLNLVEESPADSDLVLADLQLAAFAVWLEAQAAPMEDAVVEPTGWRLTLSRGPGDPLLFQSRNREQLCRTPGYRSLEERCARLGLQVDLLDDAHELQWNFDGTFHEMAPMMCHFAIEARRRNAAV